MKQSNTICIQRKITSTNQEKNRRKKKEKKMPIYKGKEEQKRNSTNKPKEKAVNLDSKEILQYF